MYQEIFREGFWNGTTTPGQGEQVCASKSDPFSSQDNFPQDKNGQGQGRKWGVVHPPDIYVSVGLQMSAIGLQMSAVGLQMSAVDLQMSAVGPQMSAVDLQMSAVGLKI